MFGRLSPSQTVDRVHHSEAMHRRHTGPHLLTLHSQGRAQQHHILQQLLCLSLVLPLFGADCSGPLGAGKLCTRLSFSFLLPFTYTSAGVLEQSMGARNRVGIELSYRPARQHRLVESIP
jgi:hypothetical protein